MRILFALTYYRPHISGLTIYVQRLAEALAAGGHHVTVLTSHYDKSLPYEEEVNGVHVVRVPVLFRISKGVIMPTFPKQAIALLREHDVASIHLPQFEASLMAVLARFVVRRPVILTYHCDLRLPEGWFNRFVDQVVFISNYMAGLLADRIVAYTQDYAEHSRFLSRFLRKIEVIPPPVVIPPPEAGTRADFLSHLSLDGRPVVGFAARLATEKGAEYLLGALEHLLPELPDLHLLFAGEYKNVLGEEAYFRRLEPIIERYRDHMTFLGVLNPRQMADFYAACDLLVLPSINSTESFGLVQVEAMLCGTPVVASNLPGVRQPVRMTGMGEIAPIRDSEALAEAMLKVLTRPESYLRPREEIARIFDMNRTLSDYERLFEREIERVREGGQRSQRRTGAREHGSGGVHGQGNTEAEEQEFTPAPSSTGSGQALHSCTPAQFESHLAEVPPHRVLLRSVEAELMGRVALEAPVLDVGCGDGHFAAVAYNQPIDVGVDLPRPELNEARARGAYRRVVPASGTALPFADASFRTVVSNSVLEHIPDLDDTLCEISRVVAPGGAFAFTTPSEHFGDFLLGSAAMRRLGLPAMGEAYARWFDGISDHFHRLSPAEWEKKLDAVGLVVRHWHYYFPEEAHHVFDLSHYLGAPTILFRKSTGRWIPHPALYRPIAGWLRRYSETGGEAIEAGAYLFFVCEKPADVNRT
ncbi:MAG: glycosyltransferase [Anaerolineae bacterium]